LKADHIKFDFNKKLNKTWLFDLIKFIVFEIIKSVSPTGKMPPLKDGRPYRKVIVMIRRVFGNRIPGHPFLYDMTGEFK
jgi:hypothetical protein